MRDIGANAIAIKSLRESAECLLNELSSRGLADFIISIRANTIPRSPDLMIRSGALGSRAAAAMVSAMSPLSIEEQTTG